WSGLAVVVEVDDHALTLSAVGAEDQKVRLLGQQVIPALNLLAWKNRLLDALANACVRHSRRDPRDSAQAEQMLFDQLDRALETYRKGQLVELDVQAEHWYQNLILRPEEVAGFCTSLVQQAVKGMELLLGPIAVQDAVQEVLLTETAGRLPGLAAALEKATGDKAPATLLAGDAAAQAAQRLAGRVSRGDLPRGHLGSVFPFSGGHAPASLVNHQPKRVLPLRTADL
ncbi:MAG: hypothetical protein JO112_11675, partial [Planctomycetes bacterium]|nr:hypothetical protein [Planctomycetota bacterium]